MITSMTHQVNRRMPPRQRWPFPNCGVQATALGAICAIACLLLLLTSPPDRIDRFYEVAAILAGVLAGLDVHAARAVSRVNGHVSHTVSEGVESVTGVVGDAMDVTESLQDRLIGKADAHRERASGNVHPFMAALESKRRAASQSAFYFDVVIQGKRAAPEDDGIDAAVLPLRSSAS